MHLIAVDVAEFAEPAGVTVSVSGTKWVGRAYVETMQQRRGG
jgi:hypothetical protein